MTQPSLCEEDNIEQFGTELNQVVEVTGCNWLVLDMQNVTLITSSAVGKLIGLHRNLHRREGRLGLCGIKGVIRNVFQTAKLIDYFHVAPTANDAVELLQREKANLSATSIGKPK